MQSERRQNIECEHRKIISKNKSFYDPEEISNSETVKENYGSRQLWFSLNCSRGTRFKLMHFYLLASNRYLFSEWRKELVTTDGFP
jgi:hypothetical protein